jgi:AmmeMemoRadiSam system protein B/AmmeMemoRadiSam system protein A
MPACNLTCCLVLTVVISLLAACRGAAQEQPTTRPACRAGTWYPGDPQALARYVDGLLAKAPPGKAETAPLALIVPHAGYQFSAPVAVTAYKALQGRSYRRVLIIAFSHQFAGDYEGVALPTEWSAYETPLGNVPVDREVIDVLKGRRPFVVRPGVDRLEHSLELQLPFLQRALKEFRLVPMMVGRMTDEGYAAAAQAILPLLDGDTLIVVSSDFTHYGPAYGYRPFASDIEKRLTELADQAAKPLLNGDFDGFAAHLDATDDTICGRNPILLLLRILSMKGGAVAARSGFDTSGHMTGDWTNSVTYQAFVFTRRPYQLDETSRGEALRLARETVSMFIKDHKVPRPEADRQPAGLREHGACFVTLQNHGRLRGCIGNMEAQGPLWEAIVQNAVHACRDPRFVVDPVTPSEIGEIDIEISRLTPMKPITDTDQVIIGRDGLLIELGPRRGVLLPQVAYERGWTREEFLREVCHKAGLPPDAWKRPEAKLYSFQAEVFGESEAASQPASQAR